MRAELEQAELAIGSAVVFGFELEVEFAEEAELVALFVVAVGAAVVVAASVVEAAAAVVRASDIAAVSAVHADDFEQLVLGLVAGFAELPYVVAY